MRLLGRVCGGILLTAGVTVFYDRIFTTASNTTIVLTFLWVIFGIAAKWGLVEAILASFSAALFSAYFFLPPIGTLSIVDPQHRLELFAFLVTALVASQVFARNKKEARQSISQERDENPTGISAATESSGAVAENTEREQFAAADLHLEKCRVSIQELVESALEKFASPFRGQIYTEYSNNLPQVYVDPDLAALTLRQLLADARQYAYPGTPITIQASVAGQSIRVGIKYSGTSGKGSTIARDIVLAHGGTIWGHGAPAQGSEFFFTLPMVPQATD